MDGTNSHEVSKNRIQNLLVAHSELIYRYTNWKYHLDHLVV